MGSNLHGLFRKLTWADFSGSVPADTGGMWAQAAPGFSPTGIGTTSPNGKSWFLADTVQISITMDSQNSWVIPSVKTMSQDEQTRLLNHEQGHYNLVALLARDFFLELMQLKPVAFNNSMEVSNKVKAIYGTYQGLGQPLQDLYDSLVESDHGKNAAGQAKWDGFIQKAFNTPRTPPMTTADGKAYKLEILKVVRDAGLKI